MPRPTGPVLEPRRVNRATLARQLLLEPARLDPVAAIERVGGLQAQEPASPYIALWSRLADFDAARLDAAFAARQVVKATLMRATVHAVSRRDYLRFLPAVLPLLRARRPAFLGEPDGDTETLAADALAFARVPRSNVELRDRFGEASWWKVRRHAPLVHVPSGGPWSFGRRPMLVSAEAWLGEPFAGDDEAIEHLVRRYLAAFGPATTADLASWSRLTVARLRVGIRALESRDTVRRFRDERGRELLDLAGAPLPDPDTPAPPRYLPMWDSLLLAHADRTRVLADEHRPIVIARNGDVLPTFLVDGSVAGLWWTELDGGRTRIVREPFEPLSRAVERQLDELGDRLAAFLEPREPRAYGRYRRTRARRPVAAPVSPIAAGVR